MLSGWVLFKNIRTTIVMLCAWYQSKDKEDEKEVRTSNENSWSWWLIYEKDKRPYRK